MSASNKLKRDRNEHYTGAASEHLVAGRFLKRRFQVYWPSVQQGAVDFVVCKDGVFQRVQVKTATWIRAGNHKYLQCRTRLTKIYKDIGPSELYDLLAILAPDGRLWVIPADVIKSSNLCLDGTGPQGTKRSLWNVFLWEV